MFLKIKDTYGQCLSEILWSGVWIIAGQLIQNSLKLTFRTNTQCDLARINYLNYSLFLKY